MSDRGRGDNVWKHGEKSGLGWMCKYCKTGKGGGGATRFKEHLAGRGSEVMHYHMVPPDVRDYFRVELDRTAQKKKSRIEERLRREKIAAEGNVREEDDEVLQRVLQMSWEEDAFARQVRDAGGHYEHGGGTGSSQPPTQGQGSDGGDLLGMLRKSTSSRRGSSREPTVQTRWPLRMTWKKASLIKSQMTVAHHPIQVETLAMQVVKHLSLPSDSQVRHNSRTLYRIRIMALHNHNGS